MRCQCGSDAGIAAAVQQAQDALKTSLAGIKTIMEALGAAELSPASAWSQIDDGLNVVHATLDSITSYVFRAFCVSLASKLILGHVRQIKRSCE